MLSTLNCVIISFVLFLMSVPKRVYNYVYSKNSHFIFNKSILRVCGQYSSVFLSLLFHIIYYYIAHIDKLLISLSERKIQ